ncbi:MAG: hypothetical protein M1812_003494 [Candelaria pacifica]|nr:MAG: hypothetical protein M1812_003494 [Candelaria pacifica]
MPTLPLESFYNKYIDAINSHSSLSPFVHEHVTHNGRRMSTTEYEALIEASFASASDIHFKVDKLLTTEDSIAARIWFDCTPQKEFLGFQPTGRMVHFAEHVFYRVRDGKIEEVWSVLDTQAVARQLGGSEG